MNESNDKLKGVEEVRIQSINKGLDREVENFYNSLGRLNSLLSRLRGEIDLKKGDEKSIRPSGIISDLESKLSDIKNCNLTCSSFLDEIETYI